MKARKIKRIKEKVATAIALAAILLGIVYVGHTDYESTYAYIQSK